MESRFTESLSLRAFQELFCSSSKTNHAVRNAVNPFRATACRGLPDLPPYAGRACTPVRAAVCSPMAMAQHLDRQGVGGGGILSPRRRYSQMASIWRAPSPS